MRQLPNSPNMTPEERQKKIAAILQLLDLSLLFTLEGKEEIKKRIATFTDQMIDDLGRALAGEHKNRAEIDKVLTG